MDVIAHHHAIWVEQRQALFDITDQGFPPVVAIDENQVVLPVGEGLPCCIEFA